MPKKSIYLKLCEELRDQSDDKCNAILHCVDHHDLMKEYVLLARAYHEKTKKTKPPSKPKPVDLIKGTSNVRE